MTSKASFINSATIIAIEINASNEIDERSLQFSFIFYYLHDLGTDRKKIMTPSLPTPNGVLKLCRVITMTQPREFTLQRDVRVHVEAHQLVYLAWQLAQ